MAYNMTKRREVRGQRTTLWAGAWPPFQPYDHNQGACTRLKGLRPIFKQKWVFTIVLWIFN
jgi:hypothetical protein